MFYPNGNYMQDLNYFNQNAIPNIYNPYPQNNFINPVNMQFQPQNQNLNAMYPAIYRIIAPVVYQVLQTSNTQYFTEDTLNNLVETVYNIVEGDINLSENNNRTTPNEQQNSMNKERNTSSTMNSNEKSNSLIKDIIKIIFLNNIRQNCYQQGRPF